MFGGKGFTKFDLTPLMKTDGVYKYRGFEWNFCTYLPSSSIFAHQIDLMTGLHPLTTENYIPEQTSVIEDSEEKIIGLNYVRTENDMNCLKDDGSQDSYGITTKILCDADITG